MPTGVAAYDLSGRYVACCVIRILVARLITARASASDGFAQSMHNWQNSRLPLWRSASATHWLPASHAHSLARNDEGSAARALLRTLGDCSRISSPHSAICCVARPALGQPDVALGALRSAADARDSWLGPMLVHTINEPLHELPGFRALKSEVFGTGPDVKVPTT